MSFSIDGLTSDQVELLDTMWSLKTFQELENWKAILSPDTLQEVELLQRMVILAQLDELLEDTTEADEVIQKIMNIDK